MSDAPPHTVSREEHTIPDVLDIEDAHNLTLRDVQCVLELIIVAAERGAYTLREFETVGRLHRVLTAFVSKNTKPDINESGRSV